MVEDKEIFEVEQGEQYACSRFLAPMR